MTVSFTFFSHRPMAGAWWARQAARWPAMKHPPRSLPVMTCVSSPSSRATAQPLRAYPRWDLEGVAAAGNRRYGWKNPRPAGYWPLGGPVDEPWAESLATLEANLRWACQNFRHLPQEIQGKMGEPATHDMRLHPREIYDLVFLGGAREIHEAIKKLRLGDSVAAGSSILSLQAEIAWRPENPRVGEEVTFSAGNQGPGSTYSWIVDGIRRSGLRFRWTFEEVLNSIVRLEVRRNGRRTTSRRRLTVAPVGPAPTGGRATPSRSDPDASSPPPSACPAGLNCSFRWRADLGRHEIRRYRPSRRSTGNLDLQILAVP